MNLGNICYVKIQDLVSYDPAKCRTGGQYAFTEHYSRNKMGEDFTVIYGTSAEIDFCPVVGRFQSCNNCNYYNAVKGCQMENDSVTEKEMGEILDSLMDFKYVKVDVENF